MKNLVYEIKKLCLANRDGSYETQRKRLQILMSSASQLTKELGYYNMHVQSHKPKHVEALVKHWKSQQISVPTIKQRMSQIRWWSVKINKQNVVAKSNDHYGIEKRELSPISKARDVTEEQAQLIGDEHVRASVLLEKAFGLRKEEAIKFTPSYAERGENIVLKASWCKGGEGAYHSDTYRPSTRGIRLRKTNCG